MTTARNGRGPQRFPTILPGPSDLVRPRPSSSVLVRPRPSSWIARLTGACPRFVAQEYANGFSGRTKISRLLFLAKQCNGDDRLLAESLALARDEVKDQTMDVDLYNQVIYMPCTEASGTGEALDALEAEDVEWIERCESTYFAKQTDLETRMAAAKTSLDSRTIAALEAELGDLLLQKGLDQEAMKHYLRMREYSRDMDDLLTMTHKAALCAFHAHNYFGVLNHVRKLETIPEAESVAPQVVARLRLLGSLTQVICQRFDVAAKMSTKVGYETLMSSPDIVSPGSFSLAIVLSAVASLNRQDLKSMGASPGFQPVLDAAPRQVRDFFSAIVSARYGEGLVLLEAEIQPMAWVDSVVGPHLGVLRQRIHDKCICEYSCAFCLVDLNHMSNTFGLPMADLEVRLAHLIQTDRLDARIDLKNHRLVVENVSAQVQAYNAAIKAAKVVIRDSALLRIRSQVLRHGLCKVPTGTKDGSSMLEHGASAIEMDGFDVESLEVEGEGDLLGDHL